MIWYMFLVQYKKSRINHLPPLLMVTLPYTCWFLWWAYYTENFKWRFHFHFEGLFWERCISKGQFVFERHWRLQNLKHCLRPLHTRDCEPVTIAPQALSLVETRSQPNFTLQTTLEGPTESVNIKMDSYMALHGSCFMVTLQALSLVEKVEPVQVCVSLRFGDQLSMWM